MNEKFFDLKKEKQDRMLNAALEIFALNGYRHASTDDMIKRAGISKGLLFHYFISKAGLYEFIYDYSVKYMIMELNGTVSIKETNFFEIMRQIEKARMNAMRNFPFIQLFLRRGEKEDAVEAIRLQKEKKEILQETYDNIYRRVDFEGSFVKQPDKLFHIVNYTLNGLLEDSITSPYFDFDQCFQEIFTYINEMEDMFFKG